MPKTTPEKVHKNSSDDVITLTQALIARESVSPQDVG